MQCNCIGSCIRDNHVAEARPAVADTVTAASVIEAVDASDVVFVAFSLHLNANKS